MLMFMLKKSEEREKIAEGDEDLINMNKLINLIYGSKEQALLYYDPEEEERMIIKSYRDEARREGLKEGEEIGIKKGEEVGIKKGEERSKIEMAKAMKSKGLSLQLIIEITGLDEKTISK